MNGTVKCSTCTPFGVYVRALREAKGITLHHMTDALGFEPTFLSRLETHGGFTTADKFSLIIDYIVVKLGGDWVTAANLFKQQQGSFRVSASRMSRLERTVTWTVMDKTSRGQLTLDQLERIKAIIEE